MVTKTDANRAIHDEPGNISRSQFFSDVVTAFCGSWVFIIIFLIITVLWIVINSTVSAMDVYPFIFFNLVLTVVSTFQGPLIMMSQNRQMERDRDAVRGLHMKLDRVLDTDRRYDVL